MKEFHNLRFTCPECRGECSMIVAKTPEAWYQREGFAVQKVIEGESEAKCNHCEKKFHYRLELKDGAPAIEVSHVKTGTAEAATAKKSKK